MWCKLSELVKLRWELTDKQISILFYFIGFNMNMKYKKSSFSKTQKNKRQRTFNKYNIPLMGCAYILSYWIWAWWMPIVFYFLLQLSTAVSITINILYTISSSMHFNKCIASSVLTSKGTNTLNKCKWIFSPNNLTQKV